MKIMNNLIRSIKLIACLSVILPAAAYSADIFKADKHFVSEEYDLAKQGYLEAAKVGNPHAYYQLGTMFQKGLGVEKDPLNALIYISMAAEYDLDKAKTTLSKLLSGLSPTQKQTVNTILSEHKNSKTQKVERLFF